MGWICIQACALGCTIGCYMDAMFPIADYLIGVGGAVAADLAAGGN